MSDTTQQGPFYSGIDRRLGGGGGGLYPSGRRPRAFLGDPGACSPEIFCNEYALRFNLVNFEKILRNVTVCALTSSPLDDFSDIHRPLSLLKIKQSVVK